MEILQYVIILVSSVGFFIALYFSLATYGIVREDLIESMPICNIHGKKERIVDTFYGRVFYLPNSLYGILYYIVVSFFVLTRWQMTQPLIDVGTVVVSFAVVAFSAYLFWALRNKLNTLCKLCITSHVLNLLIFLFLGCRYLQLY